MPFGIPKLKIFTNIPHPLLTEVNNDDNIQFMNDDNGPMRSEQIQKNEKFVTEHFEKPLNQSILLHMLSMQQTQNLNQPSDRLKNVDITIKLNFLIP